VKYRKIAGKSKNFFGGGKVDVNSRMEIFLVETLYAPYIRAIITNIFGAD